MKESTYEVKKTSQLVMYIGIIYSTDVTPYSYSQYTTNLKTRKQSPKLSKLTY